MENLVDSAAGGTSEPGEVSQMIPPVRLQAGSCGCVEKELMEASMEDDSQTS